MDHQQRWASFHWFISGAFGDHDTGLGNEKLNYGLVYNPSQANLKSVGREDCL